MKVICISGKAQHGKDTLACILKTQLEDHGYHVLIAHFGDLLKYVCCNFFDWDGKKDEAGRTLLQYVGTDVVRTQNPDFWVNFIKSILKLFPDEWDYVLIPDCRFPNEIERFKDDNFDVNLIKIIRPNFDSGLNEQQSMHPSETAMDHYRTDCCVMNDSSISDLEFKASKILKNIAAI